MSRFVRGELDVLVSTTVVEVGVDVANATAMVVLDAHRYGLAQLHQLRGRVGRGAAKSYCILVYPDDAGERERLGNPHAARTTALRSPTRICGCAGRASSPARCSRARPTFVSAIWCATSTSIARRKPPPQQIVARDPALARAEHAGLARDARGAAQHARAAALVVRVTAAAARIAASMQSSLGIVFVAALRSRGCSRRGHGARCESNDDVGARDARQRPARRRRARSARAGRHGDAQLRAGSDEQWIPGLAHATEHMMFRGSATLSSSQLMESIGITGGDFDADTTSDGDAILLYGSVGRISISRCAPSARARPAC